MTFWEKLNALCTQKGISPTKLTSEIGISSAAVTNWKKNVQPQLRNMKAICDYFNVPMSYFDDDVVSFPTEPKIESNAEEVDGYKIYNLPVFENAAAGFGAFADNYIVGYQPTAMKSEDEAKESLVIRVIGDSMQPKIENGDLVQVRKQTSVDSGDIAVVYLDEDEALVKKVVYGSDYIKLISLNPEYEPIIFSGKDVLRIRVLGRVQAIIRTP